MKTVINGVLDFFRSVTLTVCILIILLITSLLSAVEIRDVPISVIYSSPAFKVVVSLLFLNILVCTSFRIKPIFSERKRSRRIFIQGLGSLILHAGFLIILAGGVVSGTGDRKEFKLLIAEGDARPLSQEGAIMPEAERDTPEGEVMLEKFSVPFHRGGKVQKDLVSDLIFVDTASGAKVKKQVRAGYPASFKGFEFIINQYGFAPRFVLKNQQGDVIFSPYVYLETTTGLETRDSFPLADSPFIAHVLFFPDARVDSGVLKPISPQLKNPMAQIDIKFRDRVIQSGIVGVDETFGFHDYTLTMTDIRYWNLFTVITGGYGPTVLYTGFWVAIAGLILRFAFHIVSPIEKLENE